MDSLSGWTRIGIVASVIWWAAGAFILIPQFPASNAATGYMLAACQHQTSEMARQCHIMEVMLAEAQRRAWLDLAPLIALWLLGPVVAWGAWLWIRRGFTEARSKAAPPADRRNTLDF